MKNWQYFAGCLALSAGIWLIHNLSNMQTDVVSVQVIAESNIAGRAAVSSEAVLLTARCKASGFRLLYIESKKDALRVRFDADDFTHEEGDYYSIGSAQLYRYVNDIFGAGASVESFLFDKLRFRFIRELNKKVPVRVNSSLHFRPQYMQNGDFLVQPDSVLVYGPADLLANLEAVLTRTIERSDIRSSMHGEIELEVPEALRLSDETVSWSLEVSRFVEVEAQLPVAARGVPSGHKLNVYPNKATVSFRCVFPVVSNPVESASCYVDYHEFAASLTGRCVIHCDTPKGVLGFTVQPAVAECVERL